MNKRFVCLLTLVLTLVVLSGCGNPPGPHHFTVRGHSAVLSVDLLPGSEKIEASVDGCFSSVPAFVKPPLFDTTSFQLDVSCSEGDATVTGDVDASGNVTNLKVT
jgi:hypothetical protein